MLNLISMKGLGDNIYQRAMIRRHPGPVYLDTPWPELYDDLTHVHCVKPATRLRTQNKNIMRNVKRAWAERPTGRPARKVQYGSGGIYAGMAASMGLSCPAPEMDLPSFDSRLPKALGRYALLRPATVRKEWANPSRNCDWRYVSEMANALREQGITIVMVADLQPGEEWPEGELPYADLKLLNGQLSVKELLALVEHAWLVAGPVGWILPAAMAYSTHAAVVFGGQGAYNHPSRLMRPWPSRNVKVIAPDPMCMCKERNHDCRKDIPDFERHFRAYLASREAARSGAAGAD